MELLNILIQAQLTFDLKRTHAGVLAKSFCSCLTDSTRRVKAIAVEG